MPVADGSFGWRWLSTESAGVGKKRQWLYRYKRPVVCKAQQPQLWQSGGNSPATVKDWQYGSLLAERSGVKTIKPVGLSVRSSWWTMFHCRCLAPGNRQTPRKWCWYLSYCCTAPLRYRQSCDDRPRTLPTTSDQLTTEQQRRLSPHAHFI